MSKGTATSESDSEANPQHWEKTRNLTFIVLGAWFVFAFVLPWFAKELNAWSFLGFELGYYFVVQGSLIAFVVMIWLQNWRQDQIDDEFGMSEE